MSTSEHPEASVTPLRPWAFNADHRSNLDPGDGGWPDLEREEAEARFEELLDEEPFAFLELAAFHTTMSPVAPDVLAPLGFQESRLRRATAMAAQWLLHATEIDLSGLDLPLWLRCLDQAQLVGCKRRHSHHERLTSYLVEIALADDHVGAGQILIDHLEGGAVSNAFFIDAPLDHLEALMRYPGRDWHGSYRRISPATAERAITLGVGRFSVAPFDTIPGNPWPGNLLVVNFVTRVMAGDYLPDSSTEPAA